MISLCSRARRFKGFSLTEMIAAVAIFGLGVLGTLEVFTISLRSTSSSLGHTHAVLLAQAALEEIVAEGDFTPAAYSGTFGEAYSGYSWSMEIEETEQLGLYQAEVVVTWTERGREKDYTLTTLIAERQRS